MSHGRRMLVLVLSVALSNQLVAAKLPWDQIGRCSAFNATFSFVDVAPGPALAQKGDSGSYWQYAGLSIVTGISAFVLAVSADTTIGLRLESIKKQRPYVFNWATKGVALLVTIFFTPLKDYFSAKATQTVQAGLRGKLGSQSEVSSDLDDLALLTGETYTPQAAAQLLFLMTLQTRVHAHATAAKIALDSGQVHYAASQFATLAWFLRRYAPHLHPGEPRTQEVMADLNKLVRELFTKHVVLRPAFFQNLVVSIAALDSLAGEPQVQARYDALFTSWFGEWSSI